MQNLVEIITHDEVVERELGTIAAQVRGDFAGYRNHVYRVLTYAMHFLGPTTVWRETVAFALAYHDAGLWTAHDLSYLEPSEALAEKARQARAPHLDSDLIRNMIRWHHKVSPYRGPHAEVVNAVRKADWIDASGGHLRKGLRADQVAAVSAAVPVEGFPEVLMRLAADLNQGHKWGGLWRVLTRVYKF